jgi:hypothetical protein
VIQVKDLDSNIPLLIIEDAIDILPISAIGNIETFQVGSNNINGVFI